MPHLAGNVYLITGHFWLEKWFTVGSDLVTVNLSEAFKFWFTYKDVWGNVHVYYFNRTRANTAKYDYTKVNNIDFYLI